MYSCSKHVYVRTYVRTSVCSLFAQLLQVSVQTVLHSDLQGGGGGGVDSGIVSVEHSDSEVPLGPDSRFDS